MWCPTVNRARARRCPAEPQARARSGRSTSEAMTLLVPARSLGSEPMKMGIGWLKLDTGR